MSRWPAVIATMLFVLAACDNAGVNEPPGDPEDGEKEEVFLLTPQEETVFRVNALEVTVDSGGNVRQGKWYAYGGSDVTTALFHSGLWIAGRQTGTSAANIAWVGTAPRSNYAARTESGASGVFHVTPDSLADPGAHWPDSLGAPTDSDGDPRLYGDAMTWSALTANADPSQDVLAYPLEQVRVRQSVFGYDETLLLNALFVRYEIENRSSQDIADAYVGFHVDADLDSGQSTDCAFSGSNAVGYAEEDAISYTYDVKFRADRNVNVCDVPVFANAFLETPVGTGPQAISSHRILRKNDYVDPPFSEDAITGPENVLNALKGLSGSGEPMINPQTGEEAMFAFTGNPVTESGWLDVEDGIDVRSLITAGPFTLAGGETEVVTVVIALESGSVLSEAIERVRDRIGRIRADRELWQFED